MAYRRKTYKKRFMKRKKKYFKKSYKKYTRPVTKYAGNVNIELNASLPFRQRYAMAGGKLAIPWGMNDAGLTGFPNDFTDSFQNTAEWTLFAGVYMEYKIVGVKMEFIPGQFIGDQDDARVVRQMHIGTTQELIPLPGDLTVEKMQIAQDYRAYPMNQQTRKIKRYYKPAAYVKRQGNFEWRPTTDTNYCNPITYVYWEIAGIQASGASDDFILGDWNVKWFVHFRKPRFSNL